MSTSIPERVSASIQEQGASVCQSCRHGDHGDLLNKVCCCPCHGQQPETCRHCFANLVMTEYGRCPACSGYRRDAFDADLTLDARQDLSDWLGSARRDVSEMADDLLRAHSSASKCEPVTALVILPLIEQARQIAERLNELAEVR